MTKSEKMWERAAELDSQAASTTYSKAIRISLRAQATAIRAEAQIQRKREGAK